MFYFLSSCQATDFLYKINYAQDYVFECAIDYQQISIPVPKMHLVLSAIPKLNCIYANTYAYKKTKCIIFKSDNYVKRLLLGSLQFIITISLFIDCSHFFFHFLFIQIKIKLIM